MYIAGNRNRLVSLAKEQYIAWQDADDISLPSRLEKQSKFLDTHPEVGIVGGFLECFDGKGKTSIRKYAPDDATLRKKIFRYAPLAQPAAMIRRKCLIEMGEYNLKYPPAEDIDMLFRIGTKYQFANLQEIVIRYRQNDKSATFKRLTTIEKNTLEIRKKYANVFGYHMTSADKAYNLLHLLSLHTIPPKTKIKLFNYFRNSR